MLHAHASKENTPEANQARHGGEDGADGSWLLPQASFRHYMEPDLSDDDDVSVDSGESVEEELKEVGS